MPLVTRTAASGGRPRVYSVKGYPYFQIALANSDNPQQFQPN
ncbi:hypothetical protein OH687_27920 [Burkholderia anthina]|nr:hypothetical protein OH687_27920 [Burkholderia anthina]